MVASADALAAAGWQTTLVLARTDHEGPANGAPASPDVRVIPGLGRARVPKEAGRAFRDLLADLRPDVVHVHDLLDTSLHEAAGRRAPLVWNVHNFIACTSGYKYFRQPGQECMRPHGPGCVGHLLFHGCAHARDPRPYPRRYAQTSARVKALKRADLALVHSRFMADHVTSNAVERVRVAPPFVGSLPPPEPLPADASVLFVGRVTPQKGLDVLVRAIEPLGLELEVCGDGWGLPETRELVDVLRLGDRVRFHGAVDPADLGGHYERASIVVVPSLWPEPFGLVGLEAMAHARPVIGTATGGIPEWLRDRESGLLVPPGDVGALSSAIAELAGDPHLSAAMGRRGRMRGEEEVSTDRYLAAVEPAYELARDTWALQGSG